MTKIMYGYSGEGSGHSTRTREMARALIDAGHEVRLTSYDRGYENLAGEFDVFEIEGLTISSEDNRVSVLKTIVENLKRLPAGNRSLWELRDLLEDFQPNVIVTDFEPMTAYLAEHFEIPLITLDNQHRMRYVEYEVPPNGEAEAVLIRNLIRVVVPWPSVSLITAIAPGELTNDRSFLFPPLVASDVRSRTPRDDRHLLVYLTSGFDSLLPILPLSQIYSLACWQAHDAASQFDRWDFSFQNKPIDETVTYTKTLGNLFLGDVGSRIHTIK